VDAILYQMQYVGRVPLGMLIIALIFVSARAFGGEAAGEVVSVQGSVFVRPDGRKAGHELKPAKAGDSVYAGDVVNTPSNGKIKILMKDKSIIDLGSSALFKVEHFSGNSGSDRQADVSMMYGTMRAAITQKITGKGRFNVRTPAATMGVRGTEFVVKSEVRNMNEIRHVVMNPGKPLPVLPAIAAGFGKGALGRPEAPGGKALQPEAAKTEITVLQGQVDVKKGLEKPKDGRAPSAVTEPKVVSLTAGTQLVAKQGEAAPMKAVTLNTKQLAAITREVRVADNTFQKAITIDPAGMGGAIGAETQAAVVAMMAAAPQPTVLPSDVGFAGTFNVESSFTHKDEQTQTTNKNIKVLVRWRQ